MIQPVTRSISLISAIALVAVLFLPLWRIELSAPQYPEGLVLIIHPHKLAGDVEVINGLNHYIGMRTLHAEDFVEFKVLPYLIAFFAALGLISFLIKRRWMFTLWAVAYMLFGIIAMIDFYRWEYDYGHTLDPNAPIKVPGMSYQPPFIGFKQLLNFGAYSIPDAGGWIFILVGLALLAGLLFEWRKKNSPSRSKTMAGALTMTLLLSSCQSGPEPIQLGKDACAFCKMTIIDGRFGGEIITSKGRVFKFDDIHCLRNYQDQHRELGSTEVWLSAFSEKGQLLPAASATLLSSQDLHSPMGGNIAAFPNSETAASAQKKYRGVFYSWNNLPK